MNTCKNCQYWRVDSMASIDIPGNGNWCSNSKSPRYRTRTAEADTCKQFSLKGKLAPKFIRKLTGSK